MTNILHCLENQVYDHNSLEVILIEDKGGTEAGKNLTKKFSSLNISYFAPEKNWGKMGYMRNFSLSKSKGEIVLFLDDDTTILDKFFVQKLAILFERDPKLMAIIPKGNSSYSLLKNRYSYHDPYFFSNRCVAYRRRCLIDLGGFDNKFIGQEDVELVIRFLFKGFKYLKTEELQYLHPPFIVRNYNKPKAVGFSFARSKYPPISKLTLFLNGCRWLPKIVYPSYKNIQMTKFALGFFVGFIHGLKNGKKATYV